MTAQRRFGSGGIDVTVRCVIDASVAAKWFLEEEFSTQARQIRDDYAADLAEVYAPSLLPYEVLNALRFSKVFSLKELKQIAEILDGFSLSLCSFEGPLSLRAIEIADSADLSVYDASYCALAKELGFPLYTADEKLLEAMPKDVDAAHVGEYGI